MPSVRQYGCLVLLDTINCFSSRDGEGNNLDENNSKTRSFKLVIRQLD